MNVPPETPWWGQYLAQYKLASRFVKGAKVLDLGCGQGYGSRFLFELGALEVTGVDISGTDILWAQEHHGRDGVGYIVSDAKDLPFAAKSFDLVTCFQLFERVRLPDAVLQQIAKVLRPEGKFIATTVNRKRYSTLTEAPAESTHLQEFDLDEYRALLKRQFSNVDIQGLFCTRMMGPDLLSLDNKTLEFLRQQIENRIPWKVRNSLARKIFGVTYYPDENEYVLRSKNISEAPVFFAVCWR